MKLEEVEKVDDLEIPKDPDGKVDHAAEKRLVRKLDFW